MTLPATHATEAQKLTADAYVALWEIMLNPNGLLLKKLDDTVTWQGKIYEGWYIKISDITKSAGDEESRPTLTMANPNGMYKPYVAQGYFDRAVVTRRLVLRQHLLSNTNVADVQSWSVIRPANVTSSALALELANRSAVPAYVLPARMYNPPDFPTVRL